MLSYRLDVSTASYSATYPAVSFLNDFPYRPQEYGFFEAGPEYYTKRDGKDAALLIFTLSGEGEMIWKGRRGVLSPGTAVLIHCTDHHAYKTLSASPWCFRWLHLNGSGLDGYRSALLGELHVIRVGDPGEFLTRLDRLEATDPMAGHLACAEMSQCVAELLLLMLRAHNIGDGDVHSRRSEILRVLQHIDDHLDQSLDISHLAGVAGLSKYHFIRVFSDQMGSTPHHYLRQRRVEAARKYLQTTDKPVAEIVDLVGYRDTSAFIEHFRGVLGVTPAQYRKETYNWK